MKFKNLSKLATLLPLLVALTSCSNVSKVNKRPMEQERSNPVLCPVVGGSVGLYTLNGQSNMLNPKYVDLSTVGKVSLKTDYSYTLTSSTDYTFVFYGDFNKLYRNGPENCTGFDINMTYRYNYEQSENYQTGKTGTLESIVNSQYSHVALKMEMDCSRMFMQVTMPYTNQGNIKVKNCSFTFDNTASSGSVVAVQLYKGTIGDFPGIDTSYNHDLCLPSLDENFEGPFKDGHQYDLQFEYGNVPTAESLRKTITAYDVSEGAYKNVEIETDGLTGHEATLDSPLSVVFKSTDNSNNVSRFTYRVTIVDTCKPTIEIKEPARKVSYTTEITKELILENYTIEDNYPDGIKNIEVLNLDTSKENYVGVLEYQIKATDISNNIQTLDSSIELVDDVIPVISGPLELNLSANEPQTIEQILENYQANDTISGAVEVQVENETYSSNKNRPGTYVINLKAVDKVGNAANLSVKAIVQDKEGPIFYVNKTTITTFSKKTLSTDVLLRSAITQGALPQKVYTSAEIVEGEYGLVDEVPNYGTYNVKLLAHAEDGTNELVHITIEVKEQVKQDVPFLERVKMFFLNLWNRIVRFFTNGF